MTDAELTVFSWQKNTHEEVRARLTSFNGHRLADIRVWVGEDDRARFTPKGLSIQVEQLPQLLDAVKALIAAAENEANGAQGAAPTRGHTPAPHVRASARGPEQGLRGGSR